MTCTGREIGAGVCGRPHVPETEHLLKVTVAPELMRGIEGTSIVPDEPFSLVMGQSTEDILRIERAMTEWFSRHAPSSLRRQPSRQVLHTSPFGTRAADCQVRRVVLIGGTSNVGKSAVGRAVAERLRFGYRATDLLARHPGRPWRTAERAVPPHVAGHYASLTPGELVASVLGHYERLWPRIEELIRSADGLVLEGSALWPDRVAGLDAPGTDAVWLTAAPTVIRARIHAAGHYAEATPYERLLMDKFLTRTLRFQDLMLATVDPMNLPRIDTSGRTVEKSAGAVLGGAATMGR